MSAAGTRQATQARLERAVYGNGLLTMPSLRERMFTAAFQGLVYPQIWEDPLIDMEALAIQPGDHLVAIASGGCNILSYLTAGPGRVTAVDLNHAHVALNRLKLAAARHLPGQAEFADFFLRADRPSNIRNYDAFVAPRLDEASRRYWEHRDMFGRRRIGAFARGFYRTGLLGQFIGAAHLLGKVLGVDVAALAKAGSLEEQRAVFDQAIAPAFDKPLLRWILKNPASLYGLGIPPAQYEALAGGSDMHQVLRARLEKLACGFAFQDNYFARQAFGRGYGASADGAALPPYLEAGNFAAVRANASRVDVRHASMTEYLAGQPRATVNGFVLLDAQDWMNSHQLTELWRQIDRAAAPGARVIFRTAADARLLPGRVPEVILARWAYDEARSRDLNARDRSSIYGGFHLYTRNGA
jgi:S-adenosylmethionine-diacylglycerol 3-amino-3-carboxypropyl transferase